MKSLLPAAVLAAALVLAAFAQESRPLVPAEISATIKRAADWQLANPNGTTLRDWVIAPLYDGLIDVSETTGDPKYLAAVIGMGIQSGWMPGNSFYFADDHAVGHAWLDIYRMDPSQKLRLTPFQKRLDGILAKPVTEHLAHGQKPKTPGLGTGDRWSWCDALYMGPPTWARLAQATGDTRYLDFLDAEYQVTYDDLFDPAENLFYRDARFISQKSANGSKIFWSRGNGWVFAGLPILLEAYPEDRPRRQFYIELFQKMAPAIVAAQQPDGLWHPSLLDPKEIPLGETSGSAFFVYGLAWGVRHGLLDREKYWPAVERGWNALLKCLSPEGALGYVQRIGDAPSHLTADSRQLYGTGALLMAGSEILRALDAAAKVEPAELLAQAEKIVADDRTPRAYARLIPERSDDLAWENDKVVYRVYGPALREGAEASGTDAWAKSVARPVINQWYADDLAGRQSYHEDHGEGFDGYKVGDSTGVGGLCIMHDGKLVHADVYGRANIPWTKPDVLEFQTRYTYPAIDGVVYYETRTTRLRLGEHLNEITARFTLDAAGKKPAADLEIAIGLTAQTAAAEFIFQPEKGVMAIWDKLSPGGKPFGIGVVTDPDAKMWKNPRTTDPKAEEAFALARTGKNGELKYRAGFGWPGNGDIPSKASWLDLLEKNKPTPAAPAQ